MKVIIADIVHRIGSLIEGEEEISVGWIRRGVLAAAGDGSSLGTGVGVILFGVFFSTVSARTTGAVFPDSVPGPSPVLSFLLGVVVSSAAVFSEIFLFFSDVGVFVLGFVFTSFLSMILKGSRICFSFFLPGVPPSPSSAVRSIVFGSEDDEAMI